MRPFVIRRPKSLDEAQDAARERPQDGVLRAGGIDLIDRMKEGIDAPAELVELRGLADETGELMRALGPAGDGMQVGALVTLAQLAAHEGFGAARAALREAAGSAATPTIRNAATLGGNLLQRPRCWYFRHADLVCLKKGGTACLAVSGENKFHAILGGGPSFIVHPSTLACALTALDAQVEVRGAEARTIAIGELFLTPKQDARREHTLEPGEVLVRAILPKAGDDQRSGYAAVKEKQSHDWPMAEAAVKMSLQSGVMTDVRVVLGHVAPIPWRSREAEAALEGKPASAALFAEAAKAALAEARPLRDNAYKIPLAQGLLREVLHRVAGVPLPE
ncbi:FAD binding domain-containing protein [Nannocystis pusilla]|uniref:FAD binding domain-containing protein n=1 Tax=Nannocystis pusilla TaxID=889268 RepID=A0ABS7TMN9_9BACT|nr:FAD binding domain-containing protein [Nannocystis pusilla]MBZ5709491.1 FAD binding domain-containing protein [Nannocystis pusilla]